MKTKVEVQQQGCGSGIGVSLEGENSGLLRAVFCRLDVARLPLWLEAAVEQVDFPICEDGYVYLVADPQLDIDLPPGYAQIDYRGFGAVQMPADLLSAILTAVAAIYMEEALPSLIATRTAEWLAHLKKSHEALMRKWRDESGQGRIQLTRTAAEGRAGYEIEFSATDPFGQMKHIPDYLDAIRKACVAVITNKSKGLRSDSADIGRSRSAFVQAMQASGRWGKPVSAYLWSCTNGKDDPFHIGLASYSQFLRYAGAPERAAGLGVATSLEEIPLAFDWFHRIQPLGLDESAAFQLTAACEAAYLRAGAQWESEEEVRLGDQTYELLLGEIAADRCGLIAAMGPV